MNQSEELQEEEIVPQWTAVKAVDGWKVAEMTDGKLGPIVCSCYGSRAQHYAEIIAALPQTLADLIEGAEEGLRNAESDANDGVEGAQAAYDMQLECLTAAQRLIEKLKPSKA